MKSTQTSAVCVHSHNIHSVQRYPPWVPGFCSSLMPGYGDQGGVWQLMIVISLLEDKQIPVLSHLQERERVTRCAQAAMQETYFKTGPQALTMLTMTARTENYFYKNYVKFSRIGFLVSRVKGIVHPKMNMKETEHYLQ